MDIKEFKTACISALESAGMQRYRKYNVDLPLNSDFHFWVGLNSGISRGELFIEPFIGVHATAVEKMWKSICADDFNIKYDRASATYAEHLGSIYPDERSFRFKSEFNIFAEARRMSDLIISGGKDFVIEIANYRSLSERLFPKIDMLGGAPQRYACCLHLSGDSTGALDFVRAFSKKEADYMGNFYSKFKIYIQE